MAEKIKTKLKILAELRAGSTITQICKKYALHRNTVAGWKKELDIKPNDLVPAIQSAIEKKTIDQLAELGMPKKEALKILVEGMQEPLVTIFEGKGEAMIATTQKDYKTIQKYLQEYLKLVDAYPAEKIDVNINIKTAFATMVDVIIKYVPENVRNDCASEIDGLVKRLE